MSTFETIYRFFGWWIINIDVLFIFLLSAGALLFLFKRPKCGKRLIIFGCAGFIFFTVVPVGLWTFEVLENRFQKPTPFPTHAKGMILLGGSFDPMVTLPRNETAYTLLAGNFIQFVELAKAHPYLQLAYTGNAFENETAKKEFQALGIDPSTVLFADNAKDTKENALKTKELLNPNSNDQWILVTSAFHMPRAMGLFQKLGFNVIPYPVDYHTPGKYEKWFFLGLKLNLDGWQASSREWLGLLINYLMGRSDTLFPKPSVPH